MEEVMQKIQKEFADGTDLNKNSDPEELKSFLKHVLPNYDEDLVYVSDIKKHVTWHAQLVQVAPELLKPSKKKVEKTDKKDTKTAIPTAKTKNQKAAPVKTAAKNAPSAKTMNRKTQ